MALVRPPLSAPGVYIQEVPSGVRTIVGVSTSRTVFVGRTQRGPVGQCVEVSSYKEFEDNFGGLLADSPMTYAVLDFFLNGGSQAVILRVFNPPAAAPNTSSASTAGAGSPPASDANPPATPAANPSPSPQDFTAYIVPEPPANPPAPPAGPSSPPAAPASASAPAAAPASPPAAAPVLLASSPGTWGTRLTFRTNTNNISPMVSQHFSTPTWDASDLFNLAITYTDLDKSQDTETFNLVSLNPAAGARYLGTVLQQSSRYAVLAPPDSPPVDAAAHNQALKDSAPLSDTAYTQSLDALDRLDVYNIVCIPPDSFDGDTSASVYTAAAARCSTMKATLIIDPPGSWARASAITPPENFDSVIGVAPAQLAAQYCALYYPRVCSEDPLMGGMVRTRPASGIIAGIMARTDATRGVWKAPAGYETGLANITGLPVTLTDDENGTLNSQGINCLRSFTGVGPVIWGARTLAGADVLSSDFKYLPVRRLTNYIEQTLLRQTRWAVFEPNDEPLWAQLRLAIGAFMNDLFRQGAFQGGSRDKAFFVKCDATTTTQDDINRGIVNIEVGFAPLKPAEFVVIYIEQMAGQTA